MRAFIPISALALSLAAGAAFAGGNERHGGSAAQFESLDRNGDQRLSKSEASSDEQVADKFAALDSDSDGYVTKDEYTARMQQDQRDRSTDGPMPDEPRDPY
ncbi:MAG TPA: EF-hand domain-containing protein [Steroidobacteraceae bacterium]|nr:EF-hand domain-containing protein [Steroidobacteraceae bacterium]